MKLTTDKERNMVRVGYWMNQKKIRKYAHPDFINMCRCAGLELVQLDLQQPLEQQGPFTVILHKLTDYIIKAERGDAEAKHIIASVEEYLANHPEVIVIDPFQNVRKLLDRTRTYSLIQDSPLGREDGVFIPSFVELSTANHEENVQTLRNAGIRYPFVCKPTVAHGCTLAHQMALIFNEEGVRDVSPPCVAMNFVSHNAVLYKVYAVGEEWFVVERPSLKNFNPSDQKTIFFDSHSISKADSNSFLTQLDEADQGLPHTSPSTALLDKITATIRRELGMALFGVDVVIENLTGRYAIVDINAFPGYDGLPNFHQCLVRCIVKEIERNSTTPPPPLDITATYTYAAAVNNATPELSSTSTANNNPSRDYTTTTTTTDDTLNDSGIDTADSSDEKKHKKNNMRVGKRLQGKAEIHSHLG